MIFMQVINDTRLLLLWQKRVRKSAILNSLTMSSTLPSNSAIDSILTKRPSRSSKASSIPPFNIPSHGDCLFS